MRAQPKVKMFVEPTGLYSRAMTRVANAIKKHAPAHIVFVDRAEDADVQVLHVIDWCDEFLNWPRPYIAIQYCLESTSQRSAAKWDKFWSKAQLVWSYYDLAGYLSHAYRESGHSDTDSNRLFHAPLGADEIFRSNAQQLLHNSATGVKPFASESRNLIVTSGYVSGPCAEAIEEVWNAAERTGWAGLHIGPPVVEGMRRRSMPADWHSVEGCTDTELAAYYRRAYFVSGLRYGEGFELPAVEGVLCGALPLVFGQRSQLRWFSGICGFMPERLVGRRLANQLEELFSTTKYEDQFLRATRDCLPAGSHGVSVALARFNWASIIPDMFEAAGL